MEEVKREGQSGSGIFIKIKQMKPHNTKTKNERKKDSKEKKIRE